MGITQLSKLITQHCSSAIKERPIKYYSGKIIAIDASLSIYQFLIAVRSEGVVLNSTDGETTSHIVGLFYRTIRMVENGIKPVFVFDGKPPEMKIGELTKRLEKREEADRAYKLAEEIGDKKKMEMYDKRKTKITSKHVEDCQTLLKLMGIPFIIAPSEAEAYCAHLCRTGKVHAVATEDMDALTFGAPLLLRNLNSSEAKNLPIREYNLKNVLEGLEISMDEFIDLCILLGCDFCDSIKGIGPQKALKFIKKYKTIENIIAGENLEIEEGFLFEKARLIFKTLGNVAEEDDDLEDFQWGQVEEMSIIEFLVGMNGFSEERVKKGLARFKSARTKPRQMSLSMFTKKQ
ncbi:Flap endonuclease 1 [Astathelohania contejeani]|uniref:Flap endonuclease 1 n=1 Tax=Astathelohania contejeani TaxID=164912 RepID=A0ABQ7HWI0_9MICR|nr:Flap endonuclease 1 [Thelohania contejeani]